MANYRSLVGGYFANPDASTSTALKPAIRFNNPGAINGNTAWVQAYQGFVQTVVIGGGNPIAVFESPEQGVALWYELMKKYRTAGAKTVKQIITRYGGGQNYAAYVAQVAKWVGLSADQEIKLDGDDATLLKFATAMFRYEAGSPTPLSDKQILFGFNLARGATAPDDDDDEDDDTVEPTTSSGGFWAWLFGLFKPKPGADKGIPSPVALKGAPWVAAVRACTGIKETPGSGNTAAIMAWRDDIGKAFPEMAAYAKTFTADSIPWCGFGLGGALARVGIRPPFGAGATDKFMWADAWSHNWGTKLDKPLPGCIGVRTRNGGGHVTMVEKFDGTRLWCRGFNQSDAVNVSQYTLDNQWTGFYWPKGYPIVAVEPDISNSVQAGKED